MGVQTFFTAFISNFATMFQSPNPDYKELVEKKFIANRFSHQLGFRLTDIQEGFTQGQLLLEEKHQQQNGFAHGGIILSLCDIVMGFAAFTMINNDQHVVTAEIKVSCLRPGVGEKLIAKGWVLKPGRQIHFCESEVWAVSGGKETLVAKASSSMAVMLPGKI